MTLSLVASFNQSISQLISVNHTTNQSINQSINQSYNQSINQSINLNQSTHTHSYPQVDTQTSIHTKCGSFQFYTVPDRGAVSTTCSGITVHRSVLPFLVTTGTRKNNKSTYIHLNLFWEKLNHGMEDLNFDHACTSILHRIF